MHARTRHKRAGGSVCVCACVRVVALTTINRYKQTRARARHTCIQRTGRSDVQKALRGRAFLCSGSLRGGGQQPAADPGSCSGPDKLSEVLTHALTHSRTAPHRAPHRVPHHTTPAPHRAAPRRARRRADGWTAHTARHARPARHARQQYAPRAQQGCTGEARGPARR